MNNSASSTDFPLMPTLLSATNDNGCTQLPPPPKVPRECIPTRLPPAANRRVSVSLPVEDVILSKELTHCSSHYFGYHPTQGDVLREAIAIGLRHIFREVA